ncbi:MAG: PAS domain-containing sensor histidine kinase [Longimonas sp.]|uniref:PAS domain-containing sensor histidine kinase n=1 Tax=Longimonas sp. TaxID=2039626 RepID=UPI00335FD69D
MNDITGVADKVLTVGGVGLLVFLVIGLALWWRYRASVSKEIPSDEEASADTPEEPSFHNAWIDRLSVGVVVVDSTYQVEQVNVRARSLLCDDALSEGAVLPQALAQRMLNEEGAPLSFRWHNDSGKALSVQVETLRRSDGLHRVITLLDNTRVLRTEATLRETDRLLRAILQTSVAAVAVVNAHGTITYANKQAESILGLKSGTDGTWTYEQIGWTLTPVDADMATRRPLHDVLHTHKTVRDMRCAVTWPDGTRKYISLNAAPLPHDKRPSQVVFSVQEITGRYQAEQQLRKEQHFAEAAINSLPGLFFMVDANGRYQRWNETLKSVAGYTEDELHDHTLDELVAEEDRPRMREAIRTLFGENIGFRIEVQLVTHCGTRVPYVFTGARFTINETSYAVGVALDITAQRKRERALQEARREAEDARANAEQMNALKTSFLANMSHEVRTPLTAMIGYANIMVEEENPPERFASHIVTGGKRLLNTLDDILLFSQLEAGTYMPSPAPVDIEAHIKEAVRSAAPQAKVVIDGPDNAKHVSLDRGAVACIARHLIRNAAAFTDREGQITVSIGHESGKSRLTVRDTGAGMPASYIPRATQPFTQASTGMARVHEGSGLGLAIVHKMAQLMQGSVSIESAEGEGTTVTVWMRHLDATYHN